jgi:hypothetical protein
MLKTGLPPRRARLQAVHPGEPLGEGADRDAAVDQEHQRRLQHQPDRGEFERVEAHPRHGVRVQREGADVAGGEGVAVRPGAQHLLHRDVAAGAGAVVDHHRLAERRLQRVLQHARGEVGLPAGREADDQVDRPLRPGAGAATGLGAGETGGGKPCAGGQHGAATGQARTLGTSDDHAMSPP